MPFSEWIKFDNSPITPHKAAFFDAETESDWAAAEYTKEEIQKIEAALKYLPSLEGQTVLEPGCGTGRLTCMLAARVGSKGRVLAMDISSKMVVSARKRLAGCRNVELACAPLEWICLPGGSVDTVFCHQVFPHFDDKSAAVALMARLLRPGGRFVILHLIGIEQINDIHRNAGTAVADDIMPATTALKRMLAEAHLNIEHLNDKPDGYLLAARKQ